MARLSEEAEASPKNRRFISSFQAILAEEAPMKKSRFTERQIVAILSEAENAKLKRMYADLALENRAMKDLIEKKL